MRNNEMHFCYECKHFLGNELGCAIDAAPCHATNDMDADKCISRGYFIKCG